MWHLWLVLKMIMFLFISNSNSNEKIHHKDISYSVYICYVNQHCYDFMQR